MLDFDPPILVRSLVNAVWHGTINMSSIAIIRLAFVFRIVASSPIGNRIITAN
jgi:hypothetical protein